MSIRFDFKGNLVPDVGIHLSHETCKQVFASPELPGGTFREKLWEAFEEWLATYRRKIDPKPEIWLDGSFVNNRKRPNDLDFVVLVPHEMYAKPSVQAFFEAHFEAKIQPDTPLLLDYYSLVVFPADHPDYVNFQADYAYWQHFFTRTRRNFRTNKADRKGFIILKYG